MADGRFVSRSISTNEQLASVSLLADYLFQRCIPHLDVEGRMTGNPALIKATVVPLRADVTAENIPALIGELASAADHEGTPLVVWYELNGVKVLQFPGFDGQQKGLRKEREAASRLPARADSAKLLSDSRITPDEGRSRSRSKRGISPAEVKRSEVKGREEKKSAPDGAAAESGDSSTAEQSIPPKTTWLTPFADAWRERFGGEMAMGAAAKALKPLVDEWGADEARRRWTHYLAATEGAFANAARFAATFGEWNAPRVKAAGTSGAAKIADAAYLRAAALWPIYRQLGFVTAIPTKQRVTMAADDMVTEGNATTADAFVAELRVARPWDYDGVRNDAYVIDQIAQRLREQAAKGVAA